MTKLLQFLKSPEFTFGVHAFYSNLYSLYNSNLYTF